MTACQPCTRSELDGLYRTLGVRLPENVERSLLRHNGSGLTDVIPSMYALYSVPAPVDRRHG
ncbi:hypothetical protein [Streptomyces sp. NPDC023327]|uniref:hypothetical protein n=1 Tax=Streptomyces sp. NPDC023327 TaxID=3157088 RepID=UPI003406F051